ncbi:HNH endonuclease [Neobacillus soli]|uniref:HNH endonuclease n=1 Tax=Neobacillus soli TaxID=220688 RepID=UPI001FD28DFE|nr:HNH endonuclease [Neobacillus soli]
MPIPKNINTDHIKKALQKIEREGVPERRESTRFNLLYEGKYYPPKYVISIANIFANGEEYSSTLFNGGFETNKFLRNLGFTIVENNNNNNKSQYDESYFYSVPELEPVNRPREYNSYPDQIRDSIVYEYLFNSRTHRWLDEHIIGLNPDESKGYQAMGILHFIGLKDKHKGIFSDYDVQEAIGVLEQHENDFKMIVDCLERLNIEGIRKKYLIEGLEDDKEPIAPPEDDKQGDINKSNTKSFDYTVFNRDLNNKEYVIGNETKYYILVVKFSPLWNLQLSHYKYIVYILEDSKLVKQKEVQSEKSKNILTEAKREGIKLLHQLNSVVAIEDVTMVHYKQDRPNANPWQKEDSKDILAGLFKEYNSAFLETSIKDIDSEESEGEEYHRDGATSYYYGKRYERNPVNRAKAIRIHGLNCAGCGFNFEKVYGERGKDFIEIHHIKPLSTIQEEVVINPETDLVPVCSNCHRMIHRRKDDVLTIEELKSILIMGSNL